MPLADGTKPDGRTLTIARIKTTAPADVDAPLASEFDYVCGMHARSLDLSANPVDTTIPDCENPGAPLVNSQESGRQNRQFQGSGLIVVNDVTKAMLEDARLAKKSWYMIAVPGWGTFAGIYSVSASLSGDMEDKLQYNLTFTLADGGSEVFTAEA